MKQHSQEDQEAQQGPWVQSLQAFPALTETPLPPEASSPPKEDAGPTYGLSFGSIGAMGSRHTSVTLLTLFSWGSNQAHKTWVSFFSFAARLSTQTRQTGRSLQEEERQKGESEEEEEEDKSPRRSLKPGNENMKAAPAYDRARRSFLSRGSWRSLLTLAQREAGSVLPLRCLWDHRSWRIHSPLILAALEDLPFQVFLALPGDPQGLFSLGGRQHLGLPVKDEGYDPFIYVYVYIYCVHVQDSPLFPFLPVVPLVLLFQQDPENKYTSEHYDTETYFISS